MKSFRSTATVVALALSSLLLPTAVQAEPTTAWRTRNTGLDTDGKCTRRAFNALKNADLIGSASGNTGVFGKGGGMHVYVICQNSGAQAAIFCATDNAGSGTTTRVCDTVSRFMVP